MEKPSWSGSALARYPPWNATGTKAAVERDQRMHGRTGLQPTPARHLEFADLAHLHDWVEGDFAARIEVARALIASRAHETGKRASGDSGTRRGLPVVA